MVRLSFSLVSRETIGAWKTGSDQQRASFTYKSRLKPLEFFLWFFCLFVFLIKFLWPTFLSRFSCQFVFKKHIYLEATWILLMGVCLTGYKGEVCTVFQAPWAQETSLGNLPNPALEQGMNIYQECRNQEFVCGEGQLADLGEQGLLHWLSLLGLWVKFIASRLWGGRANLYWVPSPGSPSFQRSF